MNEYSRELGENLRKVREQKGLSLRDVQEQSGGVWKAAALGCYERAERAFSTKKLAELADFYGVPIADLLPKPADEEESVTRRIVIDLPRLRSAGGQTGLLARYVSDIQSRRFDYNGKMLSLRAEDLLHLAKMYNTTPDDLAHQLLDWGVLYTEAAG